MIIGVSLERTIRNNYAALEEKLRRGDSIRVLVVDPNSAASEIAANRVYVNVDVERTRNGIQATLKSLSNLKQTTLGKLEIRIVDYPPSVGGFVMDPETAQGVLYLKHYTFKMPDEDIPRFVLRPKDGYWYKFFTQQAQILWKNGRSY